MMVTERSFSVGIPISVFFLTLDRCLTLAFSLSYRPMHQKIVLVSFAIATAFATLFTAFIYTAGVFITQPAKADPNC